MNEKTLNEYHQYLRGKYRKKNTIAAEYSQVRLFLQYISKPVKQLTKNDMTRWQAHIHDKYEQNGNARGISSINHFLA